MSLVAVAFLVAGGELIAETITLKARTREESSPRSGRFSAVEKELAWEPAKTAVVICDMWDKHWCPGATARVAEMAPRMNDVLAHCRKLGMLIIHCPSDTMRFYQDNPGRKLAKSAPTASPRPPVPQAPLDFRKEGPLPIDDSDGGCDSDPMIRQWSPWKRQIATLEIKEGDAITDSREAFNLMRERGVDNVIIMGVHCNMCVLGRPFAIREMVKKGQRVTLVRDLTDAMYNPLSAPYVSHFTGNDLVIEHIEKYWAPTITSADLLGDKPFRFAGDKRKRLAIVIGEDEYETNKSLPTFARENLGGDFQVNLIFGGETPRLEFPGFEAIKDADAVLISVRRRALTPGQLKILRDYVRSGKPMIGIRTASHAFSSRGNKPAPAGGAYWPTFDGDVWGGAYVGHHDEIRGAAQTTVHPAPGGHEILRGVSTGDVALSSTLYKVLPLAKGAEVYMLGKSVKGGEEQPVAWSFRRADGGQSFYTSLGHKGDFANESFERLLVNGVYWAVGLPIPTELPRKQRAALAKK